jgi:hypothetical protein
MPAFMVIGGIAWVTLWLREPRPADAPGAWFPTLWFVGVTIAWYQSLKIPYRIVVQSERTIDFVSILSRTRLAPEEILSIRSRPFHNGMLQLRHAHGKLLLFNQFTDFHQFLSDLRKCHPAVELVGC